MLRAGVGFAVMKLLGHTDPGMTMRYVDVTLTDLRGRDFQLARSTPEHLAPQPKTSHAPSALRYRCLIDSLLAAQHLMLVLRRSLPNGHAHYASIGSQIDLTKILTKMPEFETN